MDSKRDMENCIFLTGSFTEESSLVMNHMEEESLQMLRESYGPVSGVKEF